ncbi:Os04g0346401 [Oryza sativa Japonica Group]|uniref:Os04g0346401 protein n=1 Tax=Oryza sativa subsp. japonica TaxID=39947 RepID=A0A0P0W951_ORYSJ|nr:Os04g0346401 [Oryza sativa Japonica Group]
MVLQSWPEDNNGSSATFTFFRDKPRWSRQGMLLTYTVSPTATDDHLAWDAMREASWSSTFRLLYLKAKKEYVEPSRFTTTQSAPTMTMLQPWPEDNNGNSPTFTFF